jgi:hypothetical protein
MSNLNNFSQIKLPENSCLTALLTVQQFQSILLILDNTVKNATLSTSVLASLEPSSPEASSCLPVVSMPNHKKQTEQKRCNVACYVSNYQKQTPRAAISIY